MKLDDCGKLFCPFSTRPSVRRLFRRRRQHRRAAGCPPFPGNLSLPADRHPLRPRPARRGIRRRSGGGATVRPKLRHRIPAGPPGALSRPRPRKPRPRRPARCVERTGPGESRFRGDTRTPRRGPCRKPAAAARARLQRDRAYLNAEPFRGGQRDFPAPAARLCPHRNRGVPA